MKKINKVLLPVMMLALMGSAIGLSLQHRSITMKAEAYFQATGTYQKVVNHANLQDGDTVLIASTNSDHVVSTCGGNPGYIYGDDNTENINYSEDRNTITLTNTYATEFTVVINENGSYAFKSTFAVNGFSFDVHTGYISCFQHNEFSNYRSIERFLWKVGHREGTPTDPKSSWTLTTDENHIIHADNVSDNDVHLAYYVLNDENMLYNGRNGFYLYKKIDAITYNVSVAVQPSKTSYNVGEAIDLSGLEVNVSHTGAITPDSVVYDEHKDRFYFQEYASNNMGGYLYVTYMHDDANADFAIPLTVTNPADNYAKVTSGSNDYRGQYMLAACVSGNDYALFDADEGGYLDGTVSGLVVTPSIYSNQWKVKVELIKINGSYRIKSYDNYNGKDTYIHVDSESGDITVGQSSIDDTPLDAVYTNDGILLKIRNTNMYMTFNSSDWSEEIKFRDGVGINVYLYGRGLNETELNNIDDFKTELSSVTNVCDSTGLSDNITDNSWNTLGNSFNALPVMAQGFLANVTYMHNQEEENSIEDLIDRYDYIVSKYPNHSDFMQRGSLISDLQPRANNIELSKIIENNPVTIVIIVCSLLAVSCLALFIYRKKKLER